MVQVSLVGPKTPSSKLVPQEPESDQNIAVFVRCRPLKPNEKKNVIELIPEQKVVKVNDRGANAMLGEKYSRTFNYDAVFGQEASQLEVYKAVVAPLIEQVVAGYNCTVFAYGQTGTGKTYTMEGERSSEELSWEDDPQCGIIPRALHQLFETLTNCVEYTVRVSFSELYNEELYDLLSAIDDTTKLKVFDDPVRKGSVVINGLEEVTVQTKAEIYEILKKGSAKRQTASTLMNACSSRSHTIFSVTVHIKENNIDGEELLKIGKLNLVDLAGSENIGRSGAIDKRAREAGNINQSLLTLGRVITSLVEKAPHVPYRESKLTRLLKDSLGGRTKTSIIATISPNVLDAEDTLSTLDYAQRAKKITNKPEINQKLSKKTLLREYTAEIERLRRDLIACREKNGFFVNEANYQALVQKAEDQEKFIEEKENEIKALKDELDRLMASFEATSEELSAKTVQLAKTAETLTETAKSLKLTETNLEEKKHLLDIHSTNEKKLLTQAEEILAVAEVATGDLSKLYTKLDCHKSLEEDNFSKLGEFQNSFISKMRHFETLLDCGASSIEDLFTSLQPKIDEKFSALCSDIQNIASQIDIHEAEEAVETMVNEINADKGVSNDIAAFGESVAQQKERLQEFKQVVKETVNHRAERLASFVSKIMDSIKCQRGEIENILLAENDRIQKQIAYRAKAIDSVRNLYEDHINAQNEELRKLRETIAGIDVNHNKRAKLQQQKIQAIQEACQQQCRLLSSLQSEESDTNAQLKTNLDLAMSQVSKAESVVSESKEKLFQNLNGISSGFDTREKLSADAINLLDALNSKNIQANLNDMTKLKEEIEESSDSVDKVTVDTLYAEEVSLIGLEKRNAKVLEALKESAKGKETAIKDLRDVLTKGMFKLQESTTQAKENAASVRSEVVQNIGSIEHQMVTWHRSCKREIAARCSEFDLLQSGRLNRYVPTGSTPQKKDFSYPRELVQTSPDEVILSRFRQAMSELNALQTPLPDDSELETKSIDSCTSTESSRTDSSTRSNVENCSPSFIPTPVLSADAIVKHSRKIREKRAKKIVKQKSVNGIKKPLQSTN